MINSLSLSLSLSLYRLLAGKTTSDDLERHVIGKLKIALGTQITTKVEGMLNDMALAADTAKHFESFCKENPEKCQNILAIPGGTAATNANKIELKVTTLTSGHWPSMLVLPELKLPHVMTTCCEVFNEFFRLKFSTRRNTWVLSQGSVVLKATFAPGKVFEMEVSPLQAVLALAFNADCGIPTSSTGSLSFSTLQEYTGLTEEYLKKVLHSLACSKYRILKKEGAAEEGKEKAGGAIRSQDSFLPNEKFTNQLKKFKIPMIALTDSNEMKNIEDSRSFAIEAAIVRTMKVNLFFCFPFDLIKVIKFHLDLM